MSHKFNENLLQLSKSKNLDEAKNEWYLIDKHTAETNDNTCICQHKVKYLNYMYNIETGYTIICGVTCCKKFNLSSIKIKNTILLEILRGQIKGEYSVIDNILIYSETVQNKLIEYFMKKINNYNLKDLDDLLFDINDLIKNYKITYLEEVKQKIVVQIGKLEREKLIEYFMKKINNSIHDLNNLLFEINDLINNDKIIYLEDIKQKILLQIESLEKEKIKELQRQKEIEERQKLEMLERQEQYKKQQIEESERQERYIKQQIEELYKNMKLYNICELNDYIEKYIKLHKLQDKSNDRIDKVLKNYYDINNNSSISLEDKQVLTYKIIYALKNL